MAPSHVEGSWVDKAPLRKVHWTPERTLRTATRCVCGGARPPRETSQSPLRLKGGEYRHKQPRMYLRTGSKLDQAALRCLVQLNIWKMIVGFNTLP